MNTIQELLGEQSVLFIAGTTLGVRVSKKVADVDDKGIPSVAKRQAQYTPHYENCLERIDEMFHNIRKLAQGYLSPVPPISAKAKHAGIMAQYKSEDEIAMRRKKELGLKNEWSELQVESKYVRSSQS